MAKKPKYQAIDVNVSTNPEIPEIEWLAINLESNQLCPYVVLDDKHFKSLSSYHLIRNDLWFAHNALTSLSKLDYTIDETIKKSLWFASSISYAKCFTTAKGRGLKLDEIQVFKDADKSLSDTHALIMNERHNYIAHAGNSGYEDSKTMLALSPNVDNKERFGLYHTMGLVLALPEERISENIQLINHVLKHIEMKLDKLYPKALGEVEKTSIDDWYKSANYPMQNINERAIRANLTAPPGGVLKNISIQVELKPDHGGVLIYGSPYDGIPQRFDGPISKGEITTNEPTIYYQLINGAHSIKVSTLGYSILR